MVRSSNGDSHQPDRLSEDTASAALEQLLRAHRDGLHAFLRRRIPTSLQSLIEPQDVLQDVYLEAFRRLAEFPGTTGNGIAFAWLLAVARNRLINLIAEHGAAKRGGGRNAMSPSQSVSGAAGSEDDVAIVLEELSVYEKTPSRSALAHEAAAAVERSLERLPDDYRRAIRMRFMDQMPYSEIAVALGRSQRAAEMVCTRAMASLRVEMNSEWR
jgi:RNA polymerase sigma-70 factor (subfamily 1)